MKKWLKYIAANPKTTAAGVVGLLSIADAVSRNPVVLTEVHTLAAVITSIAAIVGRDPLIGNSNDPRRTEDPR